MISDERIAKHKKDLKIMDAFFWAECCYDENGVEWDEQKELFDGLKGCGVEERGHFINVPILVNEIKRRAKSFCQISGVDEEELWDKVTDLAFACNLLIVKMKEDFEKEEL